MSKEIKKIAENLAKELKKEPNAVNSSKRSGGIVSPNLITKKKFTITEKQSNKLASKIADYIYRKCDAINHNPETYEELQTLAGYAMYKSIHEMFGLEVEE